MPTHPAGEQMQGVVFVDYGAADALSMTLIPKPKVSAADEVLIKVHAAALNPIDKIRLSGGLKRVSPERVLPTVLGYDAAGVVEEVGEGAASQFKVGDRVWVRLTDIKYGSMAEYTLTTADKCSIMPSNLSFAEGAAVPLAAVTALQALRQMGTNENSKVFITGGAGGVGTYGIQIAKLVFGAKTVVTTASPGAGTELCMKVGATKVVDYRSEKIETVLAGEDFDVALDTTGESWKFMPFMKKGGHIITIEGLPTVESMAQLMGKQPPMLVRFGLWLMKNKAAGKAKSAGVKWDHMFLKPNGKDLDLLRPLFEDKGMLSIVDADGTAETLADFRKAVDRLFSGRAKGKCVVKIAAE